MGLGDRWRQSRMKNPVEGQFTIAALVARAHTPGFFYVYDVDGVVSAPGVTATPVHRSQVMVRERDALVVGQVFPAQVDASKPERCVIAFPPTGQSKVPQRSERERAAQRLADEMNDGTT